MLDWAIQDATGCARAEGADLVFVLCGDVTEATQSLREYNEVLRALLPRVSTMVDSSIGLGVCLGNHDPEGLLEWWDMISPRIHTASTAVELLETPEAAVLLIPYPRRGRPPFDNLVDDGTIQGSLRAAGERIREVVQQTLAALPEGKSLIVAGHFTLAGMATRDTTFEQHHATEVIVPLDAFDGVALTAVGHVHKRQELAPNIIGVGGLIRHSWAERDDPKSYTLIRLKGGLVAWEHRNVPARELWQFEGEWSSSGWLKELVRG
jgi:DNA repair exonuclease SbcCD nuclease subunit